MPVTIDQVATDIAAAEQAPEARARAAVKSLGLEVNERTREVYNPAEGTYPTTRPPVSHSMVPRDSGPMYSRKYGRGMRR